MSPAAVREVFRRAATIARTRLSWQDRDWAGCLCMAADEQGVDVREVASAASVPLARFMMSAPLGSWSQLVAVASFDFVAADFSNERADDPPR